MFIPQNIQRYVSRLTRLSPGRSTLLSVITSASSSNVLAQTLNQCSTNGPDGAVVLSLAIDQANPATIYAGTTKGVFKSSNSGGNWILSLAGGYTPRLLVAATTPSTIYAAGRDGVHKSIEINAYHRKVTVVSGEWRPGDAVDQPQPTEQKTLDDADSCKPVEPDSPEGQLILLEAMRQTAIRAVRNNHAHKCTDRELST